MYSRIKTGGKTIKPILDHQDDNDDPDKLSNNSIVEDSNDGYSDDSDGETVDNVISEHTTKDTQKVSKPAKKSNSGESKDIKILESKGARVDLLVNMSIEERQVIIDNLKVMHPSITVIDHLETFISEKIRKNNLLLRPKLKELLLRKIIDCSIEITRIRYAKYPLMNEITTTENIVVPLINDLVELRFYGDQAFADKDKISSQVSDNGVNFSSLRNEEENEKLDSLSIRSEYPLYCRTLGGKVFTKSEGQDIDIIGVKINGLCTNNTLPEKINAPDILLKKSESIKNGRLNFSSLSYDCEGYIPQPVYNLPDKLLSYVKNGNILFKGMNSTEIIEVLNLVLSHVQNIYVHLTSEISNLSAMFYTQLFTKDLTKENNDGGKLKGILSPKFIELNTQVFDLINQPAKKYKEFELPLNDKIMKIFEDLFNIKNQHRLEILFSFNIEKLYYSIKIFGIDDESVADELEHYINRTKEESAEVAQEKNRIKEVHLTNFYLLLIERLFGSKRYNEILNKIFRGAKGDKGSLLYTGGEKALFEALSDKEKKSVKLEYDNLRKYFDQMSKNTCSHIRLVRQLLGGKKIPSQQVQLFNKLKSYMPDERELIKLFKDINKGKELTSSDMIVCNSCQFNLICPHVYEWNDSLAKNKGITQQIFNNMLKYVDKNPIRNYFYCKVCSREIAHVDTFSNIFQNSDQIMYDSINDELKQLMWGEINSVLFYVQFDKLVNINKLVRQITVDIYNFIIEVDKQLSIAKTNTSEDINNKKKLFINIYAYAYMINLMKDYDYIRFKKLKSKKSDIKQIFITAVNLLVSSKNIIIKRIQNINNEFIKNKLLEAFRQVQSIGKKTVDLEDVSLKTTENINHDPIYYYLYMTDLAVKGRVMSHKYGYLDKKAEILSSNYAKLENPFLDADIDGPKKSAEIYKKKVSLSNFNEYLKLFMKNKKGADEESNNLFNSFILDSFLMFWELINRKIFNIYIHENKVMAKKYVDYKADSDKVIKRYDLIKQIQWHKHCTNLRDLPFNKSRVFDPTKNTASIADIYDEDGNPHKFDVLYYKVDGPAESETVEDGSQKIDKPVPAKNMYMGNGEIFGSGDDEDDEDDEDAQKGGSRKGPKNGPYKPPSNSSKYTNPASHDSGPEAIVYRDLLYLVLRSVDKLSGITGYIANINRKLQKGVIELPKDNDKHISCMPIDHEGGESKLYAKSDVNINEETGRHYGNLDWATSAIYANYDFSDQSIRRVIGNNIEFNVFYHVQKAEASYMLSLLAHVVKKGFKRMEYIKMFLVEVSRIFKQKHLNKPPLTVADLKATRQTGMVYTPQLGLPIFVAHLGQLKLLMSEVELLNLSLKTYDEECIMMYVGAAPSYHITMLKYMYPGMKFILIDPANFYLAKLQGLKTKIMNMDVNKSAAEKWQSALHFLDNGYDYVIMNMLFMPDFARAIAADKDERQIVFVSDIRARTENPEITNADFLTKDEKRRLNSSPGDIDILRDNTLHNLFVIYLTTHSNKMRSFMLKHRCPFMNELDMKFVLGTKDEMTVGLFNEFKDLTGHDVRELYKNGKIVEPKGQAYLQTRCGSISTETRLIILPKNLDEPLKVEWHIRDTKEFENLLFYHNAINRRFNIYDTPVVNTSIGLCRCYDCARQTNLFYDYLKNKSPDKLTDKKFVEYEIIKLTMIATHCNFARGLMNKNHLLKFHLFTPHSLYYTMKFGIDIMCADSPFKERTNLDEYKDKLKNFNQHVLIKEYHNLSFRNTSRENKLFVGGKQRKIKGGANGILKLNAKKDKDKINKLKHKIIVGKECSKCGINYKDTHKLDINKINASLQLKKDVHNIYLFYYNKCPVDNYHDWTPNNICKKCGQNQSLDLDNIDLTNEELVSYYEKYKDVYFKELKLDEELESTDVGRYEHNSIEKIKEEFIDYVGDYEFSRITNFAYETGVDLQLLVCLGGIENFTIQQVKSGNVIMPQNIDVYSPRVFRIVFYTQHLIQNYNSMININKMINPPPELVKILNDAEVRKYEYNLLPKALDVMLDEGTGYLRDINLHKDKNNALNYVLFNFFDKCVYIQKFKDRPNVLSTTKLRKIFLSSIVKQILKFDEDTSIPGEVNWNLFKKELKNTEFSEKRGIKAVMDEMTDYIEEGKDTVDYEDDNRDAMGEKMEVDEEDRIKNTDEDLKSGFDMEDNSAWNTGEEVDNDVTVDDDVLSGLD